MTRRSKSPQPSREQVFLERRQIEEINRLEEEENRRRKAIVRGRGGRSSLLSGSERGVTGDIANAALAGSVRGASGARASAGGGGTATPISFPGFRGGGSRARSLLGAR